MKGKWAAGIPPRHLTWIMDGRLAASERPGGYSATHRKVRRQEEIIWLRENGFTCVTSQLSRSPGFATQNVINPPASCARSNRMGGRKLFVHECKKPALVRVFRRKVPKA